MKKVMLVWVLVFFAVTAKAGDFSETLKPNFPFCKSEELFDEMVKALMRRDVMHLEYLTSNGCLITQPGMKFSLLESNWGTAKVRVYLPGKKNKSMVGWTNLEAIAK